MWDEHAELMMCRVAVPDLDKVHLRYSYKHTCLVTLTVGDVEGYEEWHLPTYDPHNQNKYHYKLHSLDIYFWTHQDALQFVNGIRRVLPPAQCEVLDEPGPPPREPAEVSAVVQQLEKAAISESKTDSAQSSAPQTTNGGAAPTFPGPPRSAGTGTGTGTSGPTPPPQPQQYAPMAYNPAAPAAPEQVRHREKTPPPEDGVANPLQQTLAYDATTPFSPGLAPSGVGPLSPGVPPPNVQHPPGAPTFPGPPQHSVSSPGFAPQGFGSLGGHAAAMSQAPPAHPGIARAATMPAHGAPSPLASPGLASPGLASPYGFGTFPPGQYTPGVTHTPTPPAAGAGVPPPPPPPPPPGAPPQGHVHAQNEYAAHPQYYVPEGHGQGHGQYKPKPEARGRLEEGAMRLEKGVTGMLRKFEKKFG